MDILHNVNLLIPETVEIDDIHKAYVTYVHYWSFLLCVAYKPLLIKQNECMLHIKVFIIEFIFFLSTYHVQFKAHLSLPLIGLSKKVPRT